MALAARLGRIALILALLPGLLLAEGERLRVCLHSLVGLEEACSGMQQASSSCCSPEDSAELTLRSDAACEDGCCVELTGQAKERTAPAPRSGSSALATFALPPRLELAAVSLAPARAPSARAWIAPASHPGRAPTPLRI